MLGCRPTDTPIELNCKLGNLEDKVPVDKEQYQCLVGKLVYLSHTRLDIFFAASAVSQFIQAPYKEHIGVVNRILRYLKMTHDKGLMFEKTDMTTIEAYIDLNWVGTTVDKKSIFGYCTFVRVNLVTWRSKKKGIVARSSTETEYRAISLGICEENWLQKVLSGLHQNCEIPMKLFCDNKASISITNNPIQHDRTKHVGIDRHFIKERMDIVNICIPYIPQANSIWTVDLAYLLQRFSVSFSYFTVTFGADPNYSVESFYKDELANDLVRVDRLFQKALEAGIKIECRSLSKEDISLLMLSGIYVAIVLVDQHRLSGSWLEDILVSGICDSDSSYTGHYIVVCGYDAVADEFEIRDPASTRKHVRISSKCLDDARKCFGTDEDILLVSLEKSGKQMTESPHLSPNVNINC
ncbi:protein GUCD1 isoform X1 [Cucumis melo var. makuwa]|nr:protein GUCD1 isoform X1 [Cucumis melo var. makuwa]